MIILDTLLLGGLTFVLRRLAEAVDAQLDDAERLREDLLAAQMRLELGEITEADFTEVERSVLDRLRALRQRREEEVGASGGLRVTGVEAITVAGETVEVAAAGPDGRSRRRRPARSARSGTGAPPAPPM